MAYDDKNAYPKNAKPLESTSITGTSRGNVGIPSSAEETDLEKRLLRALSAMKTDMDKLTTTRSQLHEYYLAEKGDKAASGRSQVVMSDVHDTIEALMPEFMKIFYGGKNVVEITGRSGQQDEDNAKFMEEKINFDIQKQNEGFKVIYEFIKDSLMYKMGVVKYWWEKRDVTEKKSYKDLSADEIMFIVSDPKFIVTSVKATLLVDGGMKTIKTDVLKNIDLYPDALFELNGKIVVEKISKPVIESVPPEEFMFDIRTKKLGDSVCAHRKKVHWKKLKKYGLTREDITGEVDYFDATTEGEHLKIARLEDLGGRSFVTDEEEIDQVTHVYIYECYYNDYDEDGEKVPMKALLFGRKILGTPKKNSYKKPPFCVLSPILITHRLCGRSVAELVVEIQRLHTALIRYILDNIYFQNNGFRIINKYRIDVDSYLNGNKPGGVAFTRYDTNPSDAIYDLPVQPIAPHVLKMLEYSDEIKANRTGVTKYSQGLDAKSLNKTATGITQIMNASQKRTELMARIFAETGFKDLVEALVQMNLDYFDKEENIKIGEKWETINPEMISGKYDVVIEVGSGTGSKDMQYQQKVQMLNIYGQIASLLGEKTMMIFTPEHIKNILQDMWEDLGYRNTSKFILDRKPQEVGLGGAGAGIPGAQPQGAAGVGPGGAGAIAPPDIAAILQGSGGGV
ncbi:hypothetical protein LCGC14_0467330 [marine sediment metagenome]|uniref:Portal protein n=1 Tax=marine sediment metagenome TaxID=412755 RepID=A0A0F9SDD2_9ZZZZ